MGYEAEYRKAAEKYLDRLEKSTKQRIIDAVDKLPEGNVVKLKSREGYRLTVGSYRIVYNYKTSKGKEIIDVLLIGPRGDIYKK